MADDAKTYHALTMDEEGTYDATDLGVTEYDLIRAARDSEQLRARLAVALAYYYDEAYSDIDLPKGGAIYDVVLMNPRMGHRRDHVVRFVRDVFPRPDFRKVFAKYSAAAHGQFDPEYFHAQPVRVLDQDLPEWYLEGDTEVLLRLKKKLYMTFHAITVDWEGNPESTDLGVTESDFPDASDLRARIAVALAYYYDELPDHFGVHLPMTGHIVDVRLGPGHKDHKVLEFLKWFFMHEDFVTVFGEYNAAKTTGVFNAAHFDAQPHIVVDTTTNPQWFDTHEPQQLPSDVLMRIKRMKHEPSYFMPGKGYTVANEFY